MTWSDNGLLLRNKRNKFQNTLQYGWIFKTLC